MLPKRVATNLARTVESGAVATGKIVNVWLIGVAMCVSILLNVLFVATIKADPTTPC
jgi:hypothetical protein